MGSEIFVAIFLIELVMVSTGAVINDEFCGRLARLPLVLLFGSEIILLDEMIDCYNEFLHFNNQ